MTSALPDNYWDRRNCLREPTPAVFAVAKMLSKAVKHHLLGDATSTEKLFERANNVEVRDYIDSLWGSKQRFPEQVHYLRLRGVPKLPERMPRAKERMPSRNAKIALIERDGFHCRYCNLPVIAAELRKRISSDYPDSVPWGSSNKDQHAAFQALWLQYDHVVPASYGGESSLDNLVVSCAGCNYGKRNYHIDELGLFDPRERARVESDWDGLVSYAGGTFV